MKTISGFAAAAALLTLGLAAHAAAEPIVITGGSMLVPGPPGSDGVTLTGTRGFTLRGSVNPTEGEVSAISQCGFATADCLGGTVLSLNTRLFGVAFPQTVVTLDGISYHNIDDASSRSSIVFQLAGSVILPPVQFDPVTISAPFTIDSRSFFEPPFPADRVEITGAGGTATIRLAPALELEDVPWVVEEILYDFGGGGAAPIPEPATVLLAGAA